MKFVSLPVEVKGIEWTGDNLAEVKEIFPSAHTYNRCLFVGELVIGIGDMVYKDKSGKNFSVNKQAFYSRFKEVK